MALSEHQGLSGVLTLELRDADGRLIERRRVNNLITIAGKRFLSGMLIGEVDAGVKLSIAVGTGTDEPKITDAALGKFVEEAATSYRSISESEETGTRKVVATVSATLKAQPDAGDKVDALTEAGIHIRPAGAAAGAKPVLFNRVIFAPVNKGANMELTLSWEIVF